MADFKIDPNLKEALAEGRISSVNIDFERKRVTVWYKSKSLFLEIERNRNLSQEACEGGFAIKADYAFDIQLLLSLQGVFAIENSPWDGNHKAEFIFDQYGKAAVRNTRD